MDGSVVQVYLSDILHAVAQALLVPDIILLLAFIAYALFCIGSVIAEYFTERKHFQVSMPKFLAALMAAKQDNIPQVIESSQLLKRQKIALLTVYDYRILPGDALVALIKRLVGEEESRYDRITSRNNMAARISPMLGLMGTLIPLGPGIQALGKADTAALSSSLLIAFDTTVAGLVVAAICLAIGKIRGNWYNNYMSALDSAMATMLQKIEDMRERGEITEEEPSDYAFLFEQTSGGKSGAREAADTADEVVAQQAQSTGGAARQAQPAPGAAQQAQPAGGAMQQAQPAGGATQQTQPAAGSRQAQPAPSAGQSADGEKSSVMDSLYLQQSLAGVYAKTAPGQVSDQPEAQPQAQPRVQPETQPALNFAAQVSAQPDAQPAIQPETQPTFGRSAQTPSSQPDGSTGQFGAVSAEPAREFSFDSAPASMPVFQSPYEPNVSVFEPNTMPAFPADPDFISAHAQAAMNSDVASGVGGGARALDDAAATAGSAVGLDAASKAASANVAFTSAAAVNAAPTDATPAHATPAHATPAGAAPTNVAPTNAAPTSAAPTNAGAEQPSAQTASGWYQPRLRESHETPEATRYSSHYWPRKNPNADDGQDR